MNTPDTIAFPEHLFDDLAGWLELDVETAGVLLLSRGSSGRLLLARELLPVPDSAYRERGAMRLEIGSAGYVPALKRAAQEKAIACFVHSHPRGQPTPSRLDHGVDAELRTFFPSRTNQPSYVSLIIGGSPDAPMLTAMHFVNDDAPSTINRFRAVGKRIRLFTPTIGAGVDGGFDRHVRAFGADGQCLLGSLRVGVVGAGGTGSAVIEQLTRLGVGEIVVADHDAVSGTNLTRIHQSTVSDIATPKVKVAARLASELSLGANVTTIQGSLTSEAVARAMTDVDVLFGCTDDHAGRAILSRLAYWYLIPLIDMGVVIDSHHGELRGVFVRITTAGPHYPCLICRGVVDPIRVREEQLRPEERAARAAEGYAPELEDPDPSVVTYTTLAASLSVAELLARLFNLGEVAPGELLLRAHDRKLGARAATSLPNHYCADPARWGRGEQEPFLDQTW